MADNDNDEFFQQMPRDDKHLQLMLTDTLWGNPNVNPVLKKKLLENEIDVDYINSLVVVDGAGQKYIKLEDLYTYMTHVSKEEDLWGFLGFLTRDFRLANLSSMNNELVCVRYDTELANDFLAVGMNKPFKDTIARAGIILETSQSKGGFLRKRQGTVTREDKHEFLEPQKKGMFGTPKKGD